MPSSPSLVNGKESPAYPPVDTRSLVSRMQYFLRQKTRSVGVVIAVTVFIVVISLSADQNRIAGSTGMGIRGSSSVSERGGFHFAGAQHEGYFSVSGATLSSGGAFRFGFLTDMDELSKVEGARKPTFQSHLVAATLRKGNGSGGKNTYEIVFDPQAPVRNLKTLHNEGGRGAEFSELTVFDGHLLTADDRTGDVFEILNTEDGKDSYVVPRLVISEGPGNTDKGMKWEWSTVKDGELYLGSMGKEFTDKNGNIVNVNNLWIAVVDKYGRYRRENWRDAYASVRKALGAESPGYIIVEAVNWSPAKGQWVFLPRRISSEMYDDVQDEKRGGRKVVYMSRDFKTTKVVDLKLASEDPLKGFSSFSFIPGTDDNHILALRSIEEDCALDDDSKCKQRSSVVAIDIVTGQQLSKEVQYPELWKFEGLEFFDPYVKSPFGKS